MPTYDHIFLRTGLELRPAGERLSELLHLEMEVEESGHIYLVRRSPDGWVIGGQLLRNIYEYPTDDEAEQTLISEYETVWEARSPRCGSDVQRRRTIELFEELAARSPWPVVLIGGLDTALGAARPGEPIHWFPPDTTPEPDDRAVWLPWAAAD